MVRLLPILCVAAIGTLEAASYPAATRAPVGDSLGPVPAIRSLAASLVVALLIAGCGTIETTPPAPTPADFGGIAAELSRHGVQVDDIVSGDAGCDDRELIPTAIGLTASGVDQTKPVRIYLYIFNNATSFQKLRARIDTCARSFVTDADTFQSIEQSPYVMAGQGPWAPGFKAALRAGLGVAAGTGG